jgi:hypothetical protein
MVGDAAQMQKVVDAAAHKQKEDAAAEGEKQKVDDDAQMQKVTDAAAHNQKEDAAAAAEKRKVHDAAQMQESPPTPPPQNDNPTSQRGEAIYPHAGTRKSPVPTGVDPQDHLSHKTNLVDASTTLQLHENACEESAPTDAVDSNASTRKSPVPTEKHGRHESPLSESDLSHITVLGDANTLLLLQQNARHTHATAESVGPIGGTRKSPPTPTPQQHSEFLRI